MEPKNDIVQDAYYLVNVFKEHGKPITQLHVQKLMFLFEAYYMVMKDTPLYDCNYQAWNFGPVAPKLYKKFKTYGKNNIVLTEDESEEGNKISDEKKNMMECLYEAFQDFSPSELVNFTHAVGSPWKKAWNEKEYSTISKEEMKKWFSQYVRKDKR